MADSSVVIPFEGGLDVVTPVQEGSSGILTDCLNYEVGPIKGYKRIDGYERFDGWPDGSVANIYRVFLQPDLAPGNFLTVGARVYQTITFVSSTMIGLIVGVGDDYYDFMPVIPGAVPIVGKVLAVMDPFHGLTESLVTAPSIDYRDIDTDADVYANRIRALSASMRENVRVFLRPIAGVYFGRERGYVVIDMPVWTWDDPGDMLVGSYFRYQNKSYQLVHAAGNKGYMMEMPIAPAGFASDVVSINYSEMMGGAGAGVPTTGITPTLDVPEVGSMYAQPYILPHGEPFFPGQRNPVALAPAYAVAYTQGSQEFPDTLTVPFGGGDVQITVIDYSVTSGSFDTGDATGVLHFYVSDAFDEWTGLFGEGGFLVDGVTTIGVMGTLFMPTWAGTAALRPVAWGEQRRDNFTHYLWGTFNFLATKDFENVYAVNGYSRAGWIRDVGTERIFGNIVTQEDVTKDNPKYLAFHAGQRLLLGFANGSVQLSAVGNPFNFSGFDGAVEVGNGDDLTGVLEASGDSTLLFGSRTIRRLVGQGTELGLATISSAAGAMDYTCAVVAGVPMYVNQNGVCSLDQTSAYGDFKNSALSGAVDPWLTPRIVQDISSGELGGVVCAIPVRDKNQYRLFLGDGSVLNVSITPQGPQITRSNYRPVPDALRIPIAFSSSVSNTGEEYVLVVWDRARAASGDGGVVVELPESDVIYRLDRGWGFDGATFESYVDTAYLFNESPQFLSVTKAILYGLGYGYSSLRLQASGVEDDFDQPFEVTVQDISMPRTPQVMSRSLRRVMGEVDHANWGRAVKLRISDAKAVGGTNTEPSHILQSVRLFVQTDGIPE